MLAGVGKICFQSWVLHQSVTLPPDKLPCLFSRAGGMACLTRTGLACPSDCLSFSSGPGVEGPTGGAPHCCLPLLVFPSLPPGSKGLPLFLTPPSTQSRAHHSTGTYSTNVSPTNGRCDPTMQVSYPHPGELVAPLCSNFPSVLPISPTPSSACLLPSARTLHQEAQYCLSVPKQPQ